MFSAYSVALAVALIENILELVQDIYDIIPEILSLQLPLPPFTRKANRLVSCPGGASSNITRSRILFPIETLPDGRQGGFVVNHQCSP